MMSAGELGGTPATSGNHRRSMSTRVPPLSLVTRLNSSPDPLRQISISAVLPGPREDTSTESSATPSVPHPHPLARKSASQSLLVRSPRFSVALQEAERRRNSLARPQNRPNMKTSEFGKDDRLAIKWDRALHEMRSDDEDDSLSTRSTPSPALVNHLEAVLAVKKHTAITSHTSLKLHIVQQP